MIQQMQQLPTMKTQLLFDLESTGLLRRGSRIHCIVMRDAVDGTASVFDHLPERALLQGVKQLEQADILIGHNIIGYDIPFLKERFPDFTPQGQAVDTLVLSRLFYPHIADRDFRKTSIRYAPKAIRSPQSLGGVGLPTEVLQGRLLKARGRLGHLYSRNVELLRTRYRSNTKTLATYATEDG